MFRYAKVLHIGLGADYSSSCQKSNAQELTRACEARLVSRKLTFEVNLDAGPEDGGVKVGGLARELGLQIAPRQVHR